RSRQQRRSEEQGRQHRPRPEDLQGALAPEARRLVADHQGRGVLLPGRDQLPAGRRQEGAADGGARPRQQQGPRSREGAARQAQEVAMWTRRALGLFLGLLARAWLASLRLTLVVDPTLARAADRPWSLAFWHGQQFALLRWRRRRPTVALVSLSRDGE